LVDEIEHTDSVLRDYFSENFSSVLNNDELYSALPGHLNYGNLTDDRMRIILDRLEKIAGLSRR